MKTIYLIKDDHFQFYSESLEDVVSALEDYQTEEDITEITRHDDGTVTGSLGSSIDTYRSKAEYATKVLEDLADEFLPI